MMLPIPTNVDMPNRLGEEKSEELTYLCNSPASCSQEFVRSGQKGSTQLLKPFLMVIATKPHSFALLSRLEPEQKATLECNIFCSLMVSDDPPHMCVTQLEDLLMHTWIKNAYVDLLVAGGLQIGDMDLIIGEMVFFGDNVAFMLYEVEFFKETIQNEAYSIQKEYVQTEHCACHLRNKEEDIHYADTKDIKEYSRKFSVEETCRDETRTTTTRKDQKQRTGCFGVTDSEIEDFCFGVEFQNFVPEFEKDNDAWKKQSGEQQSNVVNKLLTETMYGCETAKELWDSLKTRHVGEEKVQQARLQSLMIGFNTLQMKDDDTVDAFTAKLNGYATKARELGKTLDESLLVRKLLDSTPPTDYGSFR
ncbi:hypothetical protein Tco_0345498 [Tanacetum coccineum]